MTPPPPVRCKVSDRDARRDPTSRSPFTEAFVVTSLEANASYQGIWYASVTFCQCLKWKVARTCLPRPSHPSPKLSLGKSTRKPTPVIQGIWYASAKAKAAHSLGLDMGAQLRPPVNDPPTHLFHWRLQGRWATNHPHTTHLCASKLHGAKLITHGPSSAPNDR